MSRLLVEFRGFAPIGMLEYWNAGIMGSSARLRAGLMVSQPLLNIPYPTDIHHGKNLPSLESGNTFSQFFR